MKNKLFLFLNLLLGVQLNAINISSNHDISGDKLKPTYHQISYKSTRKIKKAVAVLAPPNVVAGSSCGPGIVNLSATGGAGETIEWYTSQTAAVPIFTGNNYSPNLTTTTTFYVQSKLGVDTSIRVPVVGTVFTAPPAVTLTVSPSNNLISPLCLGTSVTFTASGGADLFEFSVDGVVKQSMSSIRTYTTNTLTNGQTVSVRSRYAVTLDGTITETAWGTGALENNVLSAALSGNATNGYINSLKFSPTEDKLVIGIAGKALNYRRIMVFLDTKPGGYNISNYGDENGSLPPVRAFNYFNNNPSTFDSYFAADYCVAIATDAGETNYYADVIELKNPNSLKTYLGTAATGVPTSVMGINKNNTGIGDNNLGFEVEVSKALIGYTTGDVKFFAFTMQDNAESNYNVTNSFLSPELTSTSDYGSGAINYNLKDPNPVVVAGAALTPCYSQDSITMSFASNPSTASVGPNQSKCNLTSDSLGGNTPTIGTGLWTLKSGPGTVTFADSSLGNSTATVSTKGTYVFTWTITSGQCTTSSADITVVYNITNPPTGSTTQNFCKINTPKVSDLVAVGNNVEWFLNSSGGTALASGANLVTGSYYAEQTDASTLCKSISRLKVDVIVDNPVAPTVSATQTFCNSAKVSDLIATGSNIKWYADATTTTTLISSANLVNGATYYATQTITSALTCESSNRAVTTVTINVTPVPTGSGVQTVCNSGTISSLVATGTGTISWYSNATGGSPLSSSTVLISGATYYATQTINSCESATRYPLTVTVTNPQIPVSGGNQSVCATSPLQTLTTGASVTTGTVVWYDALTNGNLVSSPILNSVGLVTYYAQNTIGSCTSTSRTAVTLEIKDSPFLNVVSKQCSLDLLTYSVGFSAASGSVITRSPAIGSIVGNSITGIPAGTAISITANKGNGCVETINITAPNCSCSLVNNPITAGDKSVCEGQSNPSLSVSVNSGETVDWYSTISGGSTLTTNSITYTPLNTIPGVYTYYAQARKIVDGCLSSSRTPVSLTITSQAAPTGSGTQTFCESQNATVANLVATGTNIKWYPNATSTTALSSATALTNGDYYATQTSATGLLCESVNRLKVTVVIDKPLPPVVASITQPTCGTITGTVFFNSLPNIGTWTIIPSVGNSVSGSGTSFEFKNLLASTNYTFKVTNGNGCTSVLSTSAIINAIPASPLIPVATNIVQPTCALPSGKLTIASQNGVSYSVDGINFFSSPIFSGLAPKNYTLYVRSNLDNTCVSQSITTTNINAVPLSPNIPTTTNIVQPTCALQSGAITITPQNGVEYSVNGIVYQSSNVFLALAPDSYTLYVRNTGDASCVTTSSTPISINSIPNAPAIPTASSIQPTCTVQSGTITIGTQNGSEYSIGDGFQDNPKFINVQPGSYTISVRFKNNTTCAASGSHQVVINAVPSPIQFNIDGDCIAIPGTDLKEFQLAATPLENSYNPGNVSYEWKDDNGLTIGTNSNSLNLSDYIKSTPEKEVFPLNYSLTITPLIEDCKATNSITVTSAYCNIQKGISPDDNGSNDNFDLSNLDVKKLEIFNRYGLKVYSKTNYVDEWKGQTDNGDILPSATYYYVIEFGNGEPTKTGWIYLIRDNDK